MPAIAQYTILFLMVATIVMFIVFPGQITQFFNIKEENNESVDKLHTQSQSWKDKITFKTKLIITGVVMLIVAVVFILITKESKTQQKNAIVLGENPESSKIFAANATTNKKKYEYQTKTTTEAELEKLKNNPKFQEMLRQKGTDKKNWVWQTAEKENKTVWKDDGESSNSEGLSEI